MESKPCLSCGIDKKLAAFSKGEKGLGGRRSTCKECESIKDLCNSCMDCGVPCTKGAKRCKKCMGINKRGENHPNWTKGKYLTDKGYVVLSNMYHHPLANRWGRVKEHIYIMSEYLGRPLTRFETVHHINTDKSDNRLENLQLRIGNHGTGATYRCSDCGSDRIEPMPLADEEIERGGMV